MRTSTLHRLGCLIGAAAAAGCLTAGEPRQQALEWNEVPWAGGTIDVALVRPDDETAGPHPVLLALPWGSGTPQLVETFVQSYWLTQPAMRNYYVVAPAVRGTSLQTDADEVIPAIFAWMESNLTIDPDRVALVGASNGGRGIFFAALSQPDRFHALVGLPGRFDGDPADLSVLADIPMRLIVGQLDDTWVTGAQATLQALTAQGVSAELEIVSGAGHVIALDPRSLLDWIGNAPSR